MLNKLKERLKKKWVVLLVLILIVVLVLIIMMPLINKIRFDALIDKARVEANNSNYGIAYKNYEKAIGIKHESYEVETEYIMLLIEDGSTKAFSTIEEVTKGIDSEADIIYICENIGDKNGELALTILENFKQKYKSEMMDELINQATAEPILPDVKYEADTYLNSFSFEFKDLNIPFGQKIYVTVDGTDPTRESMIADSHTEIVISKDTIVKARAYNLLNQCSEIKQYKYVIDTEAYNDILYTLNMATDKCSNTEVGEQLGCCSEEAKRELEAQIQHMNNLLKGTISYNEMTQEVKALKKIQNTFANSIIVETDKDELIKAIESAKQLKLTITESNYKGKMTEELKELDLLLQKTQAVKDDIRARQEEIDALTTNINKSLSGYKNKIEQLSIPTLSSSQILQLVSDAYWLESEVSLGHRSGNKIGDYEQMDNAFNTPKKLKSYLGKYFTQDYCNRYLSMNSIIEVDGVLYEHMLCGEGIRMELTTGEILSISDNGNMKKLTIGNIEYYEQDTCDVVLKYEDNAWKVDSLY